jgi:hypothetical protein
MGPQGSPLGRGRKVAKWFAGALGGCILAVVDQSQEIFAGSATFSGLISGGLAVTITLGAAFAALFELSFDYRHDAGVSRSSFLFVLWSQVLVLCACFFFIGAMKYRASETEFNPHEWTTLNTASMLLSAVALITGLVTVITSERK